MHGFLQSIYVPRWRKYVPAELEDGDGEFGNGHRPDWGRWLTLKAW